jgi:hypothetical protein
MDAVDDGHSGVLSNLSHDHADMFLSSLALFVETMLNDTMEVYFCFSCLSGIYALNYFVPFSGS